MKLELWVVFKGPRRGDLLSQYVKLQTEIFLREWAEIKSYWPNPSDVIHSFISKITATFFPEFKNGFLGVKIGCEDRILDIINFFTKFRSFLPKVSP